MMQETLHSELRRDGRFSRNYVILTIASCVIATFGLLQNSVAVIIGAMVVAPLIGPIQAFAFAAHEGDWRFTRDALLAALGGVALAVIVSGLLSAIVALPAGGSEISARTRPTLLDLGIALAAGTVGGFARVRPTLSGTIAGTAIAVALMPPLCVVGISIAQAHWSLAAGAALLFGTNFFGIALACMAVYSLSGRISGRNRIGLVTTIAVTAALVVPLAVSFAEILRETRIESAVRHELTTNTVTFRRAQLSGATFDWYRSPVAVVLSVRSASTVTPSQVRDLEAFVKTRTGLAVRLVADVNRVDVVDDAVPPAPSGDVP